MKSCVYLNCDIISPLVYTKNIPLVNVYSCGIHISYECSLCDHTIAQHMIKQPRDCMYFISYHFMSHIFKNDDGNYLYLSYDIPLLANRIYHDFGRRNGYRLCNMTYIDKTCPYFIYLVPKFSFSKVLDQFDETEVPLDRLLDAVRNKPFSCLACGGIFESFPSSEVFVAHPCNEL